MDLNLIKKPVITEKSTTNAQFNKYIFEVRKDANKLSIKETIEDIYKVSKGKEDYLEMQRSAENNLKSFAGKFPFLKKLFQDL